MHCSECDQSAGSLTDGGLCDGCQAASEARRDEILDLARELRQQEGSVEIDDDAALSEGNDNGCYVQAWVWVYFAGTKFDKEKGEDNAGAK